jgi:UTP--glucose-1-phosphate uridylyltransferase
MLSLKAGGDIRGTTAPFRVLSVVEKPLPKDAPSNFGVFGRYLLTAEIFSDLKRVAATDGGEVQLSDALAIYCQRDLMYALPFKGKHYDAGDPFGYFQAVVQFALKDTKMGPAVREYLAGLLSQEPQQSAVVAISDPG